MSKMTRFKAVGALLAVLMYISPKTANWLAEYIYKEQYDEMGKN